MPGSHVSYLNLLSADIEIISLNRSTFIHEEENYKSRSTWYELRIDKGMQNYEIFLMRLSYIQ